jgi:hypothetical protein
MLRRPCQSAMHVIRSKALARTTLFLVAVTAFVLDGFGSPNATLPVASPEVEVASVVQKDFPFTASGSPRSTARSTPRFNRWSRAASFDRRTRKVRSSAKVKFSSKSIHAVPGSPRSGECSARSSGGPAWQNANGRFAGRHRHLVATSWMKNALFALVTHHGRNFISRRWGAADSGKDLIVVD